MTPLVIEVTITPAARALVEMRAMAESPRRLPERLWLRRNRKKAAITTTGIATLSGERFIARAMASAPKPTWERPSPIIE